MQSLEQKQCPRSGKMPYHTDIKEGRQERPCQLQTYQPTLTYLQITHESSKE